MNNVEEIQEHFAHSTKPLTAELQSPSRRFPERIDAARVMVLGFENEGVTVALRSALNYEDLFKAHLTDRDGEQVFESENGVLPVKSFADDATDQEVWSCGRIKAPKGEKSVARLAFEKGRDVKTLATLVTNIREVEDIDKIVSGLEEFKAKYFADPNNPIEEFKPEFGGYPQGLIGELPQARAVNLYDSLITSSPNQELPDAPIVYSANPERIENYNHWTAPAVTDEPSELNVSGEVEQLLQDGQDRTVSIEGNTQEQEEDLTPEPNPESANDDYDHDNVGGDDFDHDDYTSEPEPNPDLTHDEVDKNEQGVIYFDAQERQGEDDHGPELFVGQTISGEEVREPLSLKNPTPELQEIIDDAEARGIAVTTERPLTEAEVAEIRGDDAEPEQTFGEALKEAMDKDADIIVGSIQDAETGETDRAYLMSITEGYEPGDFTVKGSDPANNMSVFPASTEGDQENEVPELKNITSPEGSGNSVSIAAIFAQVNDEESAPASAEAPKSDVDADGKPSFMSFLDSLEAPQTAPEVPAEAAPEGDKSEGETAPELDIMAWLDSEDDDVKNESR